MAGERFEIQVADAVLADLRDRLARVRWPDQVSGTAWERGSDLGYLQALVAYWRDHFDWRQCEAALNRLPQFLCRIDGIEVHFVHARGVGPNPLPVILTHGWPDSFVRYQKVIPLLSDPARYGGDPADAFDVIVPSLPGFGFSRHPGRAGISAAGVAEVWAKLMTEELGYPRFVAGGGDLGSAVTRYLALAHPGLLAGIHLTDIGILRPLLAAPVTAELSEAELRYRQLASDWIAREGAYIALQATKPQTLAYGLTDSPVGLAAWILEKFRAWSDCRGELSQRFSDDELLTNLMIYWVTGTIGTAAHMYYENSHSLPPPGPIAVPTAVALFAADILPPPEEWARRHLNIARWTRLPRGGHFTAFEEPELFAADLRAFCRPFRTGGRIRP